MKHRIRPKLNKKLALTVFYFKVTIDPARLVPVGASFFKECGFMNGRKGLSRIMSALLAASSMIGGASAGKKEVGKRPNSAGVILNKGSNKLRNQALRRTRAKSAPPLLRNPKTYCFGVPGLFGTAGIGYSVYRLLSKGEKKEEEKKEEEKKEEEKKEDFHMKDEKDEVSEKDNEESSDEVFELGSISNFDGELFDRLGKRICGLLGAYHCHIRKFNGKKYVGVSREAWIGAEFPFEFYYAINGVDVAVALGKACAGFESVFTFLSDKAIGDRSKFISENCVVDENGNMSNRVDGKVLGIKEYLEYLKSKLIVKNSNKLLANEVYAKALRSFLSDCVANSNLKGKVLAEAGKEIYVNEKDGKLYLRNIKKKQ